MESAPAVTFLIDACKLAEALQIAEEDCIKEFQDGRVISRFTEIWAAEKFGFVQYPRNYPSCDGYCLLADGDKVEIAIRTLTKSGIRFQASKYIGGGRSCSKDNLTASIRRIDRWLIFDIREFPSIHVFKIRTSILENWIEKGELTANPLPARKFVILLNRDAIPQYRMLQSPILERRQPMTTATDAPDPAPQPEPEPPPPPSNGD